MPELADIRLDETFALRRTVLGWDPPQCRIDSDDAAHLAFVDEGTPVAVVSHAHWPCPDEPGVSARYFWAMAVDAARQRRGLGRMLLDELARRSRIEGEQLLWADARDSAVEFYLRIGARQSPTPPEIDEITGLVDYRIIFEL